MTPSTQAPELVVVELDGGGHRLWYVRLIVEAALELTAAESVRIVSVADVVQSSEWALHLHPLSGRVRVDLVGSSADGAEIAALSRAAGPQRFVVVPDGDRFLRSVRRWPRDFTGSLLIMRGHPQRGALGRVRSLGKRRAVRVAARRSPTVRIFTLEMTVRSQYPGMARQGVGVALDPVRFAPLAVTRTEWFKRFDVPPDPPVVLVIGDLSARKFVPEILDAWSSGDSTCHLVLVGTPSAEVREQVERMADDRLHVVFGSCTDEEFDTWIAMADTVFALHRNPGASGVTLKGWVAGARLVVNDDPLTRQVCDELGIDAERVAGDSASLRRVFADLDDAQRRIHAPHVTVREGHEVPLALLGGLVEAMSSHGGAR